MRAKGRDTFGNYFGERNGQNRLSEDEVLQIYEMAHDCIYTQPEIAWMFGVSPSLVSAIKHQRKWLYLWQRPQWTTPVIEEVKGELS